MAPQAESLTAIVGLADNIVQLFEIPHGHHKLLHVAPAQP